MLDLRLLLRLFVKPGVLSPEYVPRFYRSLYDDLAQFDDAALAAHYDEHGRNEGRMASPCSDRIGFLAQIPRGKDQLILEIGPATRPALTGPDVRYFEISDRDDLIARDLALGCNTAACPDIIDYVSPTCDLNIVESGIFNTVFSSHCLEHQPDVIGHLLHVSRMLKPGGRYFLIVPDKRFCFDALIPESQPDEICLAHAERRKIHPLSTVIEHYAHTTHNDAVQHWCGNSIDPCANQRDQRTSLARDAFAEAKGAYIDVHAWQFTPRSFSAIIEAVIKMQIPNYNLNLMRVYPTVYGSFEFFVVLEKEMRTYPYL